MKMIIIIIIGFLLIALFSYQIFNNYLKKPFDLQNQTIWQTLLLTGSTIFLISLSYYLFKYLI